MVVALGALSFTAATWAPNPPLTGSQSGLVSAGAGAPERAVGPTIVDGADESPKPKVRVSGTDVEASRRGLEAMQAISYDWRTLLPEWGIRFHAATEGAYGYTLTQEHRIDIYVRPDESEALLTHVIAHELGHAVDVTFNDGDDRRRWLDLRGIEDAPWWPDNRAADFATGAGDFAESFAAWQVGESDFRSDLAAPPGAEARALMAELAAG
jgi:hypothetical protein